MHDAPARYAPLPDAADSQMCVRQNNFYLLDAHPGQLDSHDNGIAFFAQINNRRPRAGVGRGDFFRSLLQRGEKLSDAVA